MKKVPESNHLGIEGVNYVKTLDSIENTFNQTLKKLDKLIIVKTSEHDKSIGNSDLVFLDTDTYYPSNIDEINKRLHLFKDKLDESKKKEMFYKKYSGTAMASLAGGVHELYKQIH